MAQRKHKLDAGDPKHSKKTLQKCTRLAILSKPLVIIEIFLS